MAAALHSPDLEKKPPPFEKAAGSPAPPRNHPANGLMIWYGQLCRRRALKLAGLTLAAPGLLWLLSFIIWPGLGLLALSFAQRDAYGGVQWLFSLENYRRLLGFGLFGWSPDYLLILWRSVWVALVTTVICVVLSYPLTFFIATRPRRTRFLWLLLIIVPFWTNIIIRTYSWLLVLGPELWPARIAAFLGFIPEGAPLYPSSFAVYLGLVSAMLPFTALPLYASVERLNWELLEAARDLYASKIQVFTQAILPQTLPGLTVGVIVTFIPAMGTFIVSDLLGGAKFMLIGNLIQQQFDTARDWPFGAALCLALAALTLLSLAVYRRRQSSDPRAAGVREEEEAAL